MKKFLYLAAIAALPALVGTAMTIVPALARPMVIDDTGASGKQKAAPAVKSGGLLNSDATPRQAQRIAQQTNRQIARGEIATDRRHR